MLTVISCIVGGFLFFMFILIPWLCLTNLSRLKDIETHLAYIGAQLDRIADVLEGRENE